MAPLAIIMQQNTGLKPEHNQIFCSDNNPTTVHPKDPERQTDTNSLEAFLILCLGKSEATGQNREKVHALTHNLQP